MCKKCLEYGHNNRTCKKDKKIAIIPRENETFVIEPIEPYTQASQTPNVQKEPKKKVNDHVEFLVFLTIAVILGSYLLTIVFLVFFYRGCPKGL